MHKNLKNWDNFEYLFTLVAVACIFSFIFINNCLELQDPDIWLHLRAGEQILHNREIPHFDIFSSSLQNKPWIDHSWLAQVIFYLTFSLGGADSLILLCATVVTSAFVLLFLCAYRERKNLGIGAALLFVTALASQTRFNIRPENFSLLFFSAYLFLLTRLISSAWAYLLLPAQLLWVNFHGFFILGPLTSGIFWLAETLKRKKLLPWEWPNSGRLDDKGYKNLGRIFLFTCALSLVNPYGIKGALYPLRIAIGSLGEPNIYYNFVRELLPTWYYARELSAYFILLALSILLFIINLKKLDISRLLLWLILLGLSLRVTRNAVYFNFVAFLAASEALLRGLNAGKTGVLNRHPRQLVKILNCSILLIIISFTLFANFGLLKSTYYLFGEGKFKSRLLGIAADKYPQKAADFILREKLPSNIFNQFNYGSYLIYKLYPEKKVFIDGRTELYGAGFFSAYQRIINLNTEEIESAFAKFNINTALLKSTDMQTGRLCAYFFSSPQWRLVFFEEDSLIFLRNNADNETLINKLEVDLKKWVTQKAGVSHPGLKEVYPWPYIRRAWVFYYLGLYEQAIAEAKEALEIFPKAAAAYNILARIYMQRGQYDKALKELSLADKYAPANIETLISIGEFHARNGRHEQAVRVYKKLVGISPRFPEGHYLLANAYAILNKNKQAVLEFRRAIKFNPFDNRYQKALSNALMPVGEVKTSPTY